MSTATDVSVDELYDLFVLEGPESTDACDTSQPECSRASVFVVRWRADGRAAVEDRCSCARITHQCLEHGESYMGLENKDLMVSCAKCGGFMAPFHYDKIRRTT